MRKIYRLRYRLAVAQAGKNDCAPVAISVVEGWSFHKAKAMLNFIHRGSTIGYQITAMELALGRPLRPVKVPPKRGYARYDTHIAAVMDGRIYARRSWGRPLTYLV